MRWLSCLLSLLLLGCTAARHEGPPAEPANEGVRPAAAGALAFASSRASIERQLGAPTRSETRQGFWWGSYTWQGHALELGFYNDMLGRVRLEGPLSWAEAEAAARAFIPSFDASKLNKDTPSAWYYATPIGVNGVPFEAGLTFRREGETVSAIEGAMNWLD